MTLQLIGIDLAKNVFHLHGVDGTGREVFRKRVYRDELLASLRAVNPCKVVMEACGGANYWARSIESLGHQPQLIAPQYVKPFVQRNKTDWKDAEAICVAARQPHMRFVPRKSVEQQDVQNLHRVRQRLVTARTALVNEVRGLLHEYGITIPQGRRVFAKLLPEILLIHGERLSSLTKETFYDLLDEYRAIDARINQLERKMKTLCVTHPICRRLTAIPGVGVITASAIVAAVGDISVFKNGRQFAAWLGLTPREHSTGGKQRLHGISKRGDVYIRTLLIHGARIALRYAHRHNDRQSRWALDLMQRKGTNRTVVAMANKNARVIWALIAKDEEYKSFPLAA